MGACISNRIKAVTPPHTGSFRFVSFCFRNGFFLFFFYLIVFQCLIELNFDLRC